MDLVGPMGTIGIFFNIGISAICVVCRRLLGKILTSLWACPRDLYIDFKLGFQFHSANPFGECNGIVFLALKPEKIVVKFDSLLIFHLKSNYCVIIGLTRCRVKVPLFHNPTPWFCQNPTLLWSKSHIERWEFDLWSSNTAFYITIYSYSFLAAVMFCYKIILFRETEIRWR